MEASEVGVLRRIPDDALTAWRSDGYVVVEGVLDPDEVGRAQAALAARVPTIEDVRSGTKPPYLIPFPYKDDVLDDLALHPAIIDFSERALSGPVVLSHSEMLHKYAGLQDYDQDLHQDYGNNSLVVPSRTDPEQVASITFLTDVGLDLGPTGVVAAPDATPWVHRRVWGRADAPELYDLEVRVPVAAGSTLFYTMRTFHRGTAITSEVGWRHSLHIAHQRADVTWAGWRSLALHADEPWVAHLLRSLSPVQRSALGFPRPDSHFWTEETLADVERRYPGIDMFGYGNGAGAAERARPADPGL